MALHTVRCMQGFASGDLERDATAVRMFTDAGVELLLSQVSSPVASCCHY